jgi:hypothetical protein
MPAPTRATICRYLLGAAAVALGKEFGDHQPAHRGPQVSPGADKSHVGGTPLSLAQPETGQTPGIGPQRSTKR